MYSFIYIHISIESFYHIYHSHLNDLFMMNLFLILYYFFNIQENIFNNHKYMYMLTYSYYILHNFTYT